MGILYNNLYKRWINFWTARRQLRSLGGTHCVIVR
nr:MAG TPA: Protein of unknown function (DUF2684) [Caudoviricetes sp.]